MSDAVSAAGLGVRGALVVALAALVPAVGARADEGRFQDFSGGARAATLGGAFGALSDDATGVFYNPAGLVDVRMARVNVATNLLGLELVGVKAIDRELRGVNATDLIFVPSSTGYVQGVGETLPNGAYRNAIAFGTLVPEYTSRVLDTSSSSDTGERFRSALTDRRLNAGAAWAHRFGPWFRIGVAGHYLLRTVDAEESFASGRLDDAPANAFIDASTRLRASNHALRALFGAKLWLGPRATFGVVLTTPALSVWRDVTFEHTVSSSPGDGAGAASFVADRQRTSGFELQSDLPGGMRLAYAFTEPGSYTLSVDVTGWLDAHYDVVTGVNESVAERVPLALHVDRLPVANIALGFDALVADDLSLAFGLWTNFSGAPPLTVDADGFVTGPQRLSRVHMIGASVALGFHGRFGVTRVGLSASSGFGELVQPTAPAQRILQQGPALIVQDTQQTLLYLFWSSTFRFGEESSGRDYTL